MNEGITTRNGLLKRLGIFIRAGALDADICTDFVERLGESQGERAEIYVSGGTATVDDTARHVLSVEPPADIKAHIAELFGSIRTDLERHFGTSLGPSEPPHYLIYRPGDFFVPHRDRPVAASAETSDRKVSVVLFLNDEFVGGDLNLFGLVNGPEWKDIGLGCDAAPGLLIAFPSGTLHEVTPVASGTRCTVVTWFS